MTTKDKLNDRYGYDRDADTQLWCEAFYRGWLCSAGSRNAMPDKIPTVRLQIKTNATNYTVSTFHCEAFNLRFTVTQKRVGDGIVVQTRKNDIPYSVVDIYTIKEGNDLPFASFFIRAFLSGVAYKNLRTLRQENDCFLQG